MYKYPTAKIYTNNVLSEEIALERGTGQGCPLSLLLFALAIEPLAEKVRQDPNVTGVTIGKQQYKLHLFAEDLLMYFTSIEKSIPPLLEIIFEHSSVSGYKINMGKTEIMAVGKKNRSQDLQKSFKWTTSIKYLGCIMSDNEQEIYKQHFMTLLHNMRSEMIKLLNLCVNFTGRINLCKMTWLPKFYSNSS